MSTGQSIHAVPSITPSPREGIEDGPRLRDRLPKLWRSRALHRQPQYDIAVAPPGPRIALRRARTAALCPDPPGFSFAIIGAMLTQLIVGREVQGGDS